MYHLNLGIDYCSLFSFLLFIILWMCREQNTPLIFCSWRSMLWIHVRSCFYTAIGMNRGVGFLILSLAEWAWRSGRASAWHVDGCRFNPWHLQFKGSGNRSCRTPLFESLGSCCQPEYIILTLVDQWSVLIEGSFICSHHSIRTTSKSVRENEFCRLMAAYQ